MLFLKKKKKKKKKKKIYKEKQFDDLNHQRPFYNKCHNQ